MKCAIRFKCKSGFTLVEILLVVTIVVLLAAMSLPGLLRARHTASESNAIGNLRIISSACISYNSSQAVPTYPPNLASLGSVNPIYIDPILAGATAAAIAKQGYFYTYTLLNSSQFTCVATPAIAGATGTRNFFLDETGVIRLNDAAGAPVE